LSHDVQDEDLIILAALEALDVDLRTDSGEVVLPRDDEAGETLTRLYVEALGLLPFSLAPAVPAPAVRQRLMAIVQGDETQEVDPATTPRVMTASAPAPAVSAPAPSPASTTAPPLAPMAPIIPIESRRAPRRWPLVLAASVALLFAGFSAFLYFGGLVQQGREIDRLHAAVQAEREKREEVQAQLSQLENQLATMRSSMSLVTTPGVEVAAMRPAADGMPVPSGASGLLFIAADHQHWHLSVRGLQPQPQRHYQLWFVADSGTRSGGTFDARPGSPMDLSSEHMPHDTREILITLEEPGAQRPTGPPVLRAVAPVKII
jgi:Anti-sigma-K factor rskA